MATFRAAGAIFGFGILVLCLGLFVAPLVTAGSGTAEQSVSLTDGESQELRQNLDVEASIDASNNATVTVVDTTTFNQNTTELSEGESGTVTISGEEIDVSYGGYIAGNDYAVLTFEYPATFGMEANTRLFYDNLGLLVSVIGLLICLTGVVMGVRLA